MATLKQWVHIALEDPSTKPGRRLATFITVVILLNVLAVMVETITSLPAHWLYGLKVFELASVAIFSLEYLLRLWVCTLNPDFASGIVGRIRYALTFLAIVDLLAVLPFYLPLTFALDLRVIRLLRLFRMIRFAKVARYTEALHLIGRVFRSRRAELVLVAVICGMMLIFSATLLFCAEHDAQPEAFSSIPAALWWGVVTVTTVGYGDIYPVTIMGKIIASLFALIGIALFALPAGIFAGGFAEQLRHKATDQTCPHCGLPFSES